MKEIIKCNYKLKSGVLIHVGGEAYSNANLTDEVAKAYLEKYPNTTFFEVVPSEPVEDDATTDITTEEATTETADDDATEDHIEPVDDDATTDEPVDDVPEQVKRGRKKKED